MRRFLFLPLLACLLGVPAGAVAQEGQPPRNALATWLRNAYTGRRNNLIQSAENVPEDLYGLRPGPQ